MVDKDLLRREAALGDEYLLDGGRRVSDNCYGDAMATPMSYVGTRTRRPSWTALQIHLDDHVRFSHATTGKFGGGAHTNAIPGDAEAFRLRQDHVGEPCTSKRPCCIDFNANI